MEDLLNAYKSLGYTRVKEVQTPDGTGYYMTNNYGSGSVYVPPNAVSSTAVVGMYPGMGINYDNPQSGTGQYSDYINNTVLAGNAPDGTILVFGTRYGGDTSLEVNRAVNAAMNNGVNLTNVGIMTFSGSGETGMYAAGIVSSEHPELQVRVLNADAYTHGYDQHVSTVEDGTARDYNSLAAAINQGIRTNMGGNVVVVNYLPDSDVGYENWNLMMDDIQHMATSGHDTIIVTNNSSNHGYYRVSFIENGGIEWLAGKSKMDESIFVRMERYNSETGQWESCSLNDLQAAGIELPSGEIVQIKSNLNDAVGLYNELKEAGGDLQTFANAYKSDDSSTLASNLSYVSSCMDTIRSQINEHGDLNYQSETDHDAKVIGAMYSAANYYGAVTNKLYGDLAAETEAVYGIANAIFQMDGFASQIAESTLTDGMSSLFASTNPAVAQQLENLSNRSKGLIDTLTSAVAAGGRYDELKTMLSSSTAAGSIGKISLSSLDSAVNAVLPSLDNEVANARQLSASVTDFMSGIGASNILKGGVWEDVKLNMVNYQNLLKANENAATHIQDAVLTAMGIIKDYIDNAAGSINAMDTTDYGSLATLGELDDSKLPELEAALREMQVKIDETDAKVKQLEDSRHMVPDGYTDPKTGEFVKTGEHQEPSEEYIQVFRDELAGYVSIKETLDSYKAVLDGFGPVVQAAQEIINQAIDDVNTMYANPVKDTKGNLTFNSDFNLNLDKYSDYIDVTKDYKTLINDYYDKLNAPAEESHTDTQVSTEPVGASNLPPAGRPSGGPSSSPSSGPSSTPSSSPSSSGGQPTQSQTKPEPKTEVTTHPNNSQKQPYEPKTEATQITPSIPTEPVNNTPSQDDEIITVIDGSDHQSHVGPTGKTHVSRLATDNGENVTVETPAETPAEPAVIENELSSTSNNEYFEAQISKPIEVVNEEPSVTHVDTKSNNSLKTMGIASAVGVTLGAVSLGAHSIIKNKDDEEEKEDYGYNK